MQDDFLSLGACLLRLLLHGSSSSKSVWTDTAADERAPRLTYLLVGAIAALWFLSAVPCSAQGDRDFLREAFADAAADNGLLLSPDMPHVSLLLGNRPVTVKERRGREAVLVAPASEVTLQARTSRQGPFQFCHIRPAPGSFLAPEELKLAWGFPMQYNESMTLDADALEGHPLYVPDGTIPPAHYLNWGTLFYNREHNLAISRWGARTGPESLTQLHIWTQTGSPDLEVTIFAWHPADHRLWWAEWYQDEERREPGTHRSPFPVLSPLEISWAPGERQSIDIVPGRGDDGRSMDWTLIDDVSGQVVAHRRFTYQLPVTHISVDVGQWPTGLYRAGNAGRGDSGRLCAPP